MQYVALVMLAISMAAPLAFGESYRETTGGGSLDIEVIPGDWYVTVGFLDPLTDEPQTGIKYTIEVRSEDVKLFGPASGTHDSTNPLVIPISLANGTNEVVVSVSGVTSGDMETATITVVIAERTVPDWIREDTRTWVRGQAGDYTFLAGIQYMADRGIIRTDDTPEPDGAPGPVPDWVRDVAGWWTQGKITDGDYIRAVEKMITYGAIQIIPGGVVLGGVNLQYASPVLGDPKAPLTIIEFGDYQCPKCKGWFDNTKPSIDSKYISSGLAKMYFVDLTFLGQDSGRAAEATYCARDQGAYWKFHDTLYRNQGPIGGWASHQALVGYAGNLDMDVDAFDTCLTSGKYQDGVSFNKDQSQANNISRTPSFILVGPGGTEQIAGSQQFDVFDRKMTELLN